MRIVYFGMRVDDSVVHVYRWEPPDIEPLDMRLDLRNHSPAGFNWGYSGSGPAQLALALLADATKSDTLATLFYQQFKRSQLAIHNWDAWAIPVERILSWVAEQVDLELCESVDLTNLRWEVNSDHS